MGTDKQHVMQELLEAVDYEVRSYSGRGMFGKECLAVVTSQSPGELFAGILRGLEESGDFEECVEDVISACENMKVDDMGRGTVYYFTNVPYHDEDEDEDEDEGPPEDVSAGVD